MTDTIDVTFTPTPDALALLAAFIPALSAPDVSGGEWGGLEPEPDGSRSFPYFSHSDLAKAILHASYASGLVVSFDWAAWCKTDEGQRLTAGDGTALASATPEQLVRVMTAMLRSDRFSDGTLGEFIDGGRMLAVAKRAKELAV